MMHGTHKGVECAGLEMVRRRPPLLPRHVHQQRHLVVVVVRAAGVAAAAALFISYDLTRMMTINQCTDLAGDRLTMSPTIFKM